MFRSVWIQRLGIIIVSLLIALPVAGSQDPAGVPAVKKIPSADGVEIVYSVRGKGKLSVIFIHGGFADRGFWKNQMKPFSKKYRVIALDLAGHGESGKNRKKWDLTGFAQDVRAVIEKENIRRVVLVGNSLGGPVALETAQLLPEKVIGIVAVDTFQDLNVSLQLRSDYFQKQARAFRSDFAGTMKQMVRSLFHADADPELYKQVEQTILKGSVEMAVGLMESLASYDGAEIVKKLSLPIRCINGDLMQTQVEKNRVLHPDFDAVILPHTGHFPMLERPELFNRHLEKILEKMAI